MYAGTLGGWVLGAGKLAEVVIFFLACGALIYFFSPAAGFSFSQIEQIEQIDQIDHIGQIEQIDQIS